MSSDFFHILHTISAYISSQQLRLSHGIRQTTKRCPSTIAYPAAPAIRTDKKLLYFKYHPAPLCTGSIVKETDTCQCCGKKSPCM
ncbi:CbrC family protein [Oleidesulfovibrio sp.]|uniref:CbrC family protein n=1 Tax=Oleidesulfovibrio sp. TaxID=2909707 RepID=UPI003A868C84